MKEHYIKITKIIKRPGLNRLQCRFRLHWHVQQKINFYILEYYIRFTPVLLETLEQNTIDHLLLFL